jgi:hypothetical protein
MALVKSSRRPVGDVTEYPLQDPIIAKAENKNCSNMIAGR